MSDVTIGNYTVSEKEIDLFINTLGREQQAYRSVPQFREQVRNRVEEISLFAMLGEEEGFEELSEYKESMLLAKRDILGQIAMAETLKKVAVTDEEARKLYEEQPELFTKEAKATAKHILVENEEKALDIMKQIEAGDITFEDAAKAFSSCPSKERGGSLGSFGRGQMVKEFEDAAFAGEIGKLLGPVKTQFGYHLIVVDERTDAEVPAFEDITEDAMNYVLQKKQQEAYDSKVAELRAKYIK